MTAQFPGTQRADLQVVRDEDKPDAQGDVTTRALGLLENARKVADSTVAEARAEAERLLTAARERAQQVQRDAKDLGQKLRADAERETAQVRHQAYGEAERIVADARNQVGSLQTKVSGLREEHSGAETAMRALSERIQKALHQHGPLDDASASTDAPEQAAGQDGSEHHQG